MEIKIKTFVFFLIIVVFSKTSVLAQNVIVNGDFSAGNTGFISGYRYLATSDKSQGVYGIVTSAKTWYSSAFDDCKDHTTPGTGRMLVADGATVANTKLWEQTVTVVPGQSYIFSYFLQTVNDKFPAQVEILINGVSLGALLSAPVTTCANPWSTKSHNWVAGASTTAVITIYDREISGTGNDFAIDDIKMEPCTYPAPTVTTPVALCQNSAAVPLKATASSGSTLKWYTQSLGGVASTTAPTPSVLTTGTTTYYVSQTDGFCESPRAAIVVNVNADNPALILNFRCDPSQVPAAEKYTSVHFDWSNNPAIGNTYNYSYTIDGGPAFTGTINNSSLPVKNMLPGQSATLTLSSAAVCATQVLTCTVPCDPSVSKQPNFADIAPFCEGTTPAPVLTTTSPNGITGIWNPATVSTTTSGDYVFTPDVALFPCASPQTLKVTVIPLVTPTFASIPTKVCQGTTEPVLPTSSSNTPPIKGTWSPSTVDTTTPQTIIYTFTPTPTAGQCTVATLTTASITIEPLVTPTFAIGGSTTICAGTTLTALPTTSGEGITGTWSPALNNTTTTTYTFTPTTGQCASATTKYTITVNPNIPPTFTPVNPICAGATISALPTTSNNGFIGTWSPALNTAATTTYTFTPTAGQCATTTTMTITVIPLVAPTFSSIPTRVCQGTTAPVLPTSSSNTPPITGTWSPSTVDTSTPQTIIYTFTPTAGQCTAVVLTTATITIDPIVTPTFTIGVGTTICSGATLAALPTTSIEGITGTWSPALNNTLSTTYTFKPTTGQCASATTNYSITVDPNILPTFAPVNPICSGDVLSALPTASIEGITGTWLPILDNTTTTTYTFTPTAGICAKTTKLTIVVNQPIEPNFTDLTICSGTTPPILAQTSPNGITGTWSPSSIDGNTSGTYVFTPDAPQCAITKSITVTVNPSDSLVTVNWTVTDAFTKNQVVTVIATAAGNYLYQLDSGPFQESPVFEYVASGMHSVTVKDAYGCNNPITENDVFVINYPKFFTPNGDTYNDTWNIFDLSDQVNSKIYIFDRYGKLLKGISPRGIGWDGTLENHSLPATDYWFTVEYEENGVTKIFKSHFSLKR